MSLTVSYVLSYEPAGVAARRSRRRRDANAKATAAAAAAARARHRRRRRRRARHGLRGAPPRRRIPETRVERSELSLSFLLGLSLSNYVTSTSKGKGSLGTC